MNYAQTPELLNGLAKNLGKGIAEDVWDTARDPKMRERWSEFVRAGEALVVEFVVQFGDRQRARYRECPVGSRG